MSGRRGGCGAAIAALLLGLIGCAIGAAIDAAGFFRAWLCGFLFWLGLPLAAVALVLVHDLTAGAWMATARPVLDAAAATMPLATLAGIPAFIGLAALYGWVDAPAGLANAFYLNPAGFVLRYAGDVVLWNLLAGFALWGPRAGAMPVPASLSWVSGVGLVVLAFSTGFAAIDWMLSLEPHFWSSIFPMLAGAGWFLTGLAIVLLAVALMAVAPAPTGPARRAHMADLAALLFAVTLLWAYLDFMQFLIVWEENLGREIRWYLPRLAGGWNGVLIVSGGIGAALPLLLLLWAPARRSPVAVTIACGLVLLGRIAEKWWLVLPQFPAPPPFWLDAAAVLALGGGMALLFGAVLRRPEAVLRWAPRAWRARHG